MNHVATHFESAESRLKSALENFEALCEAAADEGIDILPSVDRMRKLAGEVFDGGW